MTITFFSRTLGVFSQELGKSQTSSIRAKSPEGARMLTHITFSRTMGGKFARTGKVADFLHSREFPFSRDNKTIITFFANSGSKFARIGKVADFLHSRDFPSIRVFWPNIAYKFCSSNRVKILWDFKFEFTSTPHPCFLVSKSLDLRL